MSIHIQVLGSTSSGNSTLLWNSAGRILIDCGFSARYTIKQLQTHHFSFKSLSAILLTHLHSDHLSVSMLNRIVHEKIPLYCHNNIADILSSRRPVLNHEKLLHPFNEEIFTIGSFSAQAFAVPHDSQGGCFGFSITATTADIQKKITVATDLGYPSEDIQTHFHNADVIIIESNHDSAMLEKSSRPQWLKDRIKSIGHLSNEQCTSFIKSILGHSSRLPKAIILAHISQQCNTNCLAQQCVEDMLRQNNFNGIEVIQTFHRKANQLLRLE